MFEISIATIFAGKHFVSWLNTFFIQTVIGNNNLKLEISVISPRSVAAKGK